MKDQRIKYALQGAAAVLVGAAIIWLWHYAYIHRPVTFVVATDTAGLSNICHDALACAAPDLNYCQPAIDFNVANEALMPNRMLGECRWLKETTGKGYERNENCDPEKIIQTLYDANYSKAIERP